MRRLKWLGRVLRSGLRDTEQKAMLTAFVWLVALSLANIAWILRILNVF